MAALSYVANDIVCVLDSVFVVLGLSTVFNTVDHQLLLSRLKDRVGHVLDWTISYLSCRFQYVSVVGSSSEPTRTCERSRMKV